MSSAPVDKRRCRLAVPKMSADLPHTRVLAWPARRKRYDNPYTYLVQASTSHYGVETTELTPLRLLNFGWDAIHVHWPDMVLLRGGAIRQAVTGAVFLAVLRMHRRRGARLIWTIHNLKPHEVRSPRVARWFMSAFVGSVVGAISPSEAGLRSAGELYPSLNHVKTAVIPLGSYVGEYPPAPSSLVARRALGIDRSTTVLLALGQIRRYKNLPALVEIFTKMAHTDATLIIAGPPTDQGEVARLLELAAGNPRIRILPERIGNDDLPTLFSAADCFVAPFTDILNSASVLLALSYNCAVLAPRKGGLPEIADKVGDTWLEMYDGALSVEDMEHRLRTLPRGAPDLSHYAWPEIGQQTAEFFEKVIDQPGKTISQNEELR